MGTGCRTRYPGSVPTRVLHSTRYIPGTIPGAGRHHTYQYGTGNGPYKTEPSPMFYTGYLVLSC